MRDPEKKWVWLYNPCCCSREWNQQYFSNSLFLQ